MKTKIKGMTPYKKQIIDKVTELVCSEFAIDRDEIFTYPLTTVILMVVRLLTPLSLLIREYKKILK